MFSNFLNRIILDLKFNFFFIRKNPPRLTTLIKISLFEHFVKLRFNKIYKMQGMSEEETQLTANFLRKNLLPTTTKKLKLKDNEREFGTKIVKILPIFEVPIFLLKFIYNLIIKNK
jgi:hypothetical protein